MRGHIKGVKEALLRGADINIRFDNIEAIMKEDEYFKKISSFEVDE